MSTRKSTRPKRVATSARRMTNPITKPKRASPPKCEIPFKSEELEPKTFFELWEMLGSAKQVITCHMDKDRVAFNFYNEDDGQDKRQNKFLHEFKSMRTIPTRMKAYFHGFSEAFMISVNIHFNTNGTIGFDTRMFASPAYAEKHKIPTS